MTRDRLQRINSSCFWIILASVFVGMGIGIAGIWNWVDTANGLLWKLLGTCGAVFAAAMTASTAIACFKQNE